jgi:5-(carboxyamino)imidazole ribonucleotide synthase
MVIGVLGAGQLGRMLALAGYPLGMKFAFFDPAADCAAADVGPQIRAAWDDQAALRQFAQGIDLFTWEFENVPVATVELLAKLVPGYPHVRALTQGQDRIEEKRLFQRVGMNVHPFAAASTLAEFEHAVSVVGIPCVAKSRWMGYDGKGQAVIRDAAQVAEAWSSLGGVPLLVEQFVPFDFEVSIVATRGRGGEIVTYPLTQNVHRGGILRLSQVPAPDATASLEAQAQRHAKALLNELDYVGTLAIEFFVRGDQLLTNEFAPRVHNSGHWTIEGAVTSQFENHVRAIAGLPLGDASLRGGPSVMLNIIGDRPDTAALLRVPGLHLHDYGKAARPSRKIGHVTLHPPSPDWRAEPALATLIPV